MHQSTLYHHILFECDDEGIATLTLNRPDRLNAYTLEMGEEVVDAFRRASGDEAVRVIILTGAGRGFCAGVDLEALKASQAEPASMSDSMSDSEKSTGPKLGEEDFIRKFPLEVQACPKPVIAAINGHAIGVGITMVLPCDVRIAAEDAKLGLTFAKLGILPGLGSTHLLSRLVGMGKAQELVLGARVLLAPEAAEIGLVNHCVPGDELMARARAMALEMAACDATTLAFAKRALHEGAGLSLADAMKNEQKLSAELRATRKGGGG